LAEIIDTEEKRRFM